MNPMSNIKGTNKINERELEMGLVGSKTSWHNKYKDSAWVFMGGLPYDLTEGDVICVFSQYGEVVNINLVRDKGTGKFRGFGFLCYEDQRSSILAVDNFNGAKILSRTIRVDHVEEYKVPKRHDDEDDVTKHLRDEGCAPQLHASDDEKDEEEDYIIPFKSDKKAKSKKKKKKEKKMKKKKSKRKESSSDESDSDSSEEEQPRKKVKKDIQLKTERHDKGYDKYAMAYHKSDRGRTYQEKDYRPSKVKDIKKDRDQQVDSSSDINDHRKYTGDRQSSSKARYEREGTRIERDRYDNEATRDRHCNSRGGDYDDRSRDTRDGRNERSRRSISRDRTRRSPYMERSKRSTSRDRSRSSPYKERSKRSTSRDRSRRSPYMERSKRSTSRDRYHAKSEENYKDRSYRR